MSRATRTEVAILEIRKEILKQENEMIGYQVEIQSSNHYSNWRNAKSVVVFRLTPKPSL